MRCSVKLLAGVLALSAASFSTGVQAEEVCYKLDPFVDFLRLEFGAVTHGHRNVYGNWIAPGYYTLPVSGAYELDFGSTTVKRLGIVGTNTTTDFFGSMVCGLDGVRFGAWKVSCGEKSGTLTPTSCAGLPPSNVKKPGLLVGAKYKGFCDGLYC